MVTLVSFDIDGTMVFGSPSGPITLDTVRRAKELGYMVGSASDRPLSDQAQLWKEHNIQVDFVSLKHRLGELKERFAAERYYHIGDTEMDQHFATQAGFSFLYADALPEEGTEGSIFM